MAKKTFILIDKLETDGLQTRAALNMDVVRDYAEQEREGKAVFPPLTVFRDAKGRFWVGDGIHRLNAARQNCKEKIACEVRDGEHADALRYALGANQAHGLRRTHLDIEHAVKMAYENRKSLGLPDDVSARMVAELVGISDKTAGDQLRKFRSWAEAPTRTGSDGRTRSLPPPPTRRTVPTPPTQHPPERPASVATPPPSAPPQRPASKAVECQQDALEKPIPPGLSEIWNRRGELANLARMISDVRCALKHAQDGFDPLFGELNFSSVLGHLDLAYKEISSAVPWCVCPSCQGLGCRMCRGLGLMGKYRYETVVPRNLK